MLVAASIEAGQKSLGQLLGMDETLPGIQFQIEDMLTQNADFEESNRDVWGKIISASMILQSTHPWTVSRIQELENGNRMEGINQAVLLKK